MRLVCATGDDGPRSGAMEGKTMPDHELRKNRIGGSEAPAVFNAHQYMTALELCLSKRGQIERSAPNIRMIVGKALEQGILSIYEWKTGRKVQYHDKTVIDPTRPYMAATPDAFCVAEKRGVDAKLVWWDQRALWGDDQDSIPLMYVIQAWYYCAAFDVPRWDIAALIGMDDFRVITIERDPEVERAMLKQVEAWHARYVLGNEIPPPDGADDTDRWLQAAYPNHKRPDLRQADAAEIDLLEAYVDLRVDQRAAKNRQDELERLLKAAIK